MGFEDLQQQITEGAEFTQRPKSRGFIGVSGKAKDLEMDRLRDGLNAGFVHVAPDDALDLLARDSVLPRAPGESHDALRARLDERFQTHRESGTKASVVAALGVLGFENVSIFEDHEGTFAPGEWYSRFWIVAQPPLPFDFLTMPFVMPVSLGTDGAPEILNRAKRDILYWKASHGYPVDLIVWNGVGCLLGVTPFPFVMGGLTKLHIRIGKLLGEFTMPFRLGGYEV